MQASRACVGLDSACLHARQRGRTQQSTEYPPGSLPVCYSRVDCVEGLANMVPVDNFGCGLMIEDGLRVGSLTVLVESLGARKYQFADSSTDSATVPLHCPLTITPLVINIVRIQCSLSIPRREGAG